MSAIQSRYPRLKQEIERLTALYQRPAGSVRLIAVSKQHPLHKVVELARLGQRDMAENYLQEGVEKIEHAAQRLSNDGGDDGRNSLCWHFIGHIQSRKCRLIAENFSWVHTVDSIKIAHKLNHSRGDVNSSSGEPLPLPSPLHVLIQLNLQGEASKSGVSEAQLPALAEATAALPNLRLRGLMIIPKMEKTLQQQRAVFGRCRELRDKLNARGFHLDHLSMGMSGDMEAAIAEGATMLRIGTALFGERSARSAHTLDAMTDSA